MARATRSSATQPPSEKEKAPDAGATARTKGAGKKRKRGSVGEHDDHPPAKQLRSDEQTVALAGDQAIEPADARQIADILALADDQGLLDRVLPLPDPSSSTAQSSLRALLADPAQPLRLLRAAVQLLFPPRTRLSAPAAQQLRFCNLACSLLDQASLRSIPLDLLDLPDPDHKPAPSADPEKHAPKKYALMQRLPFATWWTSLNAPADPSTLKDLATANAELVAILPTPSAPPDVDHVTLAAYVPTKPPGYKPKLPGPRRISCGAFLHYGPYASFAPAFDQDGVELGRSTMGHLYSAWEDRKKFWEDEQDQPLHVADALQPNGIVKAEETDVLDIHDLDGLFSPEQISLLKNALGSLELEAAVHELLDRNAKALKRLEELQNRRLAQPGEFKPVEQGSEEWDTAQSILDSLCLLASLRPRESNSEQPPLVPSPSTLRKLQRTLPIAPTPGWHGTLPAEHATTLRDDATLYIKSTATPIPAPQPAPPAHTPTPAQPTSAQATVATAAAAAQAYAGYSYNYATPYRPGYQYKPGQPAPYYPNAYAPQTTAQAQAAPQYYQATGQQQYTYQSWYPYNPQQANGAGSRKGTPQPSTTAPPTTAAPAAPSAIPTSYAGFFSAATPTPGQRAVANTVAPTPTGKAYQPAAGGTWATPVAPTLPPHMRSAVAGQPGAAGPYNAGLYQPNYYGAYQATPSPAQS